MFISRYHLLNLKQLDAVSETGREGVKFITLVNPHSHNKGTTVGILRGGEGGRKGLFVYLFICVWNHQQLYQFHSPQTLSFIYLKSQIFYAYCFAQCFLHN